MDIIKLDYELDHDNKKIKWIGKIKYKDIDYISNQYEDIEDTISELLDNIGKLNREITYYKLEPTDKSYIHIIIKNKDNIIDKKKAILKVDKFGNLSCPDIKRDNNYELVKYVEDFGTQYFNKKYNKSDHTLKFKSLIKIEIELCTGIDPNDPYAEDDGFW